MDKKSWQFFIHHKHLHINTIKAKIAQIQSDITKKEKQIQNNFNAIENAKNFAITTVDQLQKESQYMQHLYNTNNILNNEIANLKKKLEEEKKRLARENGEKKILDKLLEKLRKKQQKKETQKENNLANESFLSQHFFTK